MSRHRNRRKATFQFEPRHEPLLPIRAFFMRLVRSGVIAASVVILALALGAVGFHYTERLPWLDATLNASMLLSGMGPLDHPQSNAGKVFATVYALFSGIVFLTVAALLFAPVFHRLIHHFHLELDDSDPPGRP
jgi:hypothetical protein